MKFGMSEQVIMKQYHPDAMDLYNVCSDLHKVCVDLRMDSSRTCLQSVGLLRPFKPMLAERENLEEIVGLMHKSGDEEFFIEQKLDGERMQIHKNGSEFRYWSRNGTDYSYLYGFDADHGSLTPKINSCFISSVQSVILDGEMMAFDWSNEEFLPFGMLKTVALETMKDAEAERQPCFIAFDIVLLNGVVLTDRTLAERISILQKIIEPKKGILQLVKRQKGKTMADITEALDKAISDKWEGLVIKAPNSLYSVGKRLSEWIKLKPEYIESICDSVDVLIVGGYYKRGVSGSLGNIATFLCAIALDESYTKW